MPPEKKKRLTISDYYAIVQMHRSGDKSQREIALEFGVTQERISQILLKPEYQNLTERDVSEFEDAEGNENKEDATVRGYMDAIATITLHSVQKKIEENKIDEITDEERQALKDGANTFFKGYSIKKQRDYRNGAGMGEGDGSEYLITVRDELIKVTHLLCPDCLKKVEEFERKRTEKTQEVITNDKSPEIRPTTNTEVRT